MGTILDKKLWAQTFLKALGNNTPSDSTVKFVMAWEIVESGPQSIIGCDHNPLNSTQMMPGSTACNSVGVQNYATYQDGINATKKTISNGLYGSLLHALSTNDENGLGFHGNKMAVNIAGDLSVWSTGKRNPVAQGYIDAILKLIGQAGDLPSGGSAGATPSGVTPGSCDAWDIVCLINNGLASLRPTLVNWGEEIALFLIALLMVIIGFFLIAEKQVNQIGNKLKGAVLP